MSDHRVYLEGYQQHILTNQIYRNMRNEVNQRLYLALSLTTEAGEAAELEKKAARDNAPPVDRVEMALELGDALWALTCLAAINELTLEDLIEVNLSKITQRILHGRNDEAEYKAAVDTLVALRVSQS